MRVRVFLQNRVEDRGGSSQNNFVSLNNLFIAGNCDIAEVTLPPQSLESIGKVQLVLLPFQMKPLVCVHCVTVCNLLGQNLGRFSEIIYVKVELEVPRN